MVDSRVMGTMFLCFSSSLAEQFQKLVVGDCCLTLCILTPSFLDLWFP